MCRRLSFLLLGPTVAPAQHHVEVGSGPHERNVLDVWLAKSQTPAPLVIYYHGGGFRSNDKRRLNLEFLEKLRADVAAANYPVLRVAPYLAQMQDCARSLARVGER